MIFVSLQITGIIKFKNDVCKVPKKREGVFGALFLGIIGGVLSSPCSTPVLIAILAIVAEKGNVFLGGLLLFVYSIGHTLLIIIAGTSFGITQISSKLNDKNKYLLVLKYILAFFILLLGLYMIYLGV